jgi:hypothetical protein
LEKNNVIINTLSNKSMNWIHIIYICNVGFQ